MTETEGRGVDYERYALSQLFAKLAATYSIGSVLEIPAGGEKAMPSLYSLGFAEAGCRVTLVNAEERSKPAWLDLGLEVRYQECQDLTCTALPGETDDLVWNFMALAKHPDREALLAEMGRLSRRLVLCVAVNRHNPGFYSHRLAHRLCNVPWNHGDVAMMSPFQVRNWFETNGLKVLKVGVVDTPPYPDSVGFRDIRLHRRNVDLTKIEWRSRTVEWMKTGKYPVKIKLFHLFERLPLPFRVKLLYAHLFYVLAEK